MKPEPAKTKYSLEWWEENPLPMLTEVEHGLPLPKPGSPLPWYSRLVRLFYGNRS